MFNLGSYKERKEIKNRLRYFLEKRENFVCLGCDSYFPIIPREVVNEKIIEKCPGCGCEEFLRIEDLIDIFE